MLNAPMQPTYAILESIRTNRRGQYEIVFVPAPSPPRDGVAPLHRAFTFCSKPLGHGQQFIQQCRALQPNIPCGVEVQGRRLPNGFVAFTVRQVTY